MKFTENDWKGAIAAGESMIKEGMMITVQGEELINRARRELKKFKCT